MWWLNGIVHVKRLYTKIYFCWFRPPTVWHSVVRNEHLNVCICQVNRLCMHYQFIQYLGQYSEHIMGVSLHGEWSYMLKYLSVNMKAIPVFFLHLMPSVTWRNYTCRTRAYLCPSLCLLISDNRSAVVFKDRYVSVYFSWLSILTRITWWTRHHQSSRPLKSHKIVGNLEGQSSTW